MDPISLSLAIAPLVLSSAKILAGIRSIRHKYKAAQNAVTTTQTECEVMHVALCELQALVQRNRLELTIRLKSEDSVAEAFDKVLTGCRITLDSLSLELEGVSKSAKSGTKEPEKLGPSSKIQYVWKQETMDDLVEQMRNQRNHVQFLMTVLQSDTQGEILRLVRQNTHSIQNLLNKAKSIRSSQGYEDTQSVFTTVKSVTEYPFQNSFEEQLHESRAYRRAQIAAAEDLLAAKLELLEEKYNLEEKVDELHAAIASKDEVLISKDEALNAKNAALDSKDKTIDAKDRSLISLNKMFARKQRDVKALHGEKESIKLAFDKLNKDLNVMKAGKRLKEPTNVPVTNQVVRSDQDHENNQIDEMSEDDKDSTLDELKANGFTWQSESAFNWAALNGKVGPFRMGDYTSSYKDPLTGMNYLHTASAHGHLELVEYLLNQYPKQKTFSIEGRTSGETGMTPIQLASQGGYCAIIKVLYLAGADINAVAQGLDGKTALVAAANHDHVEAVAYLLDHGASKDGKESIIPIGMSARSQIITEGYSAVLQAIQAESYAELAKMLKAKKASHEELGTTCPAIRGASLESSLILWWLKASREGTVNIFRLAMETGDVEFLEALDTALRGRRAEFLLAGYSQDRNHEAQIYLLGINPTDSANPRITLEALREAILEEDLKIAEAFLSDDVHLWFGVDVPTILDIELFQKRHETLSQLLLSAYEVDMWYRDHSRAYERATAIAKARPRSVLLLPLPKESDFGEAEG